MGLDHVITGGKGGDGPPLPSHVRDTDALVRLVRSIVAKGFKTWKLNPDIERKWRNPTVIHRKWIVGEEALFVKWQWYIMSIIVQQFPSNFQDLETGVKEQGSEMARGLTVLLKPLKIDAIMELLAHHGLFKKETMH